MIPMLSILVILVLLSLPLHASSTTSTRVNQLSALKNNMLFYKRCKCSNLTGTINQQQPITTQLKLITN
ncbi:hypothetical protein ERO13_A10G132066v2 [Gossypium hirsutum]|uniref:Uncharacterized protein n=1 Tax=Gossypium mustelinum TaxID=34275 RepID=A0A5D2XM65_GOSMU|nr:hypothetical protein ERO13_A10G132066v2 [Gossypium hirsutum]TYJ14862.1 hypothetical protein E1A91_A10G146500v1 [Gossypium mustelinum]